MVANWRIVAFFGIMSPVEDQYPGMWGAVTAQITHIDVIKWRARL